MQEIHWILKEGGKVKASSLRLLLDSLPDGQYRVDISDKAGKRSSGQNDLLHGMFRWYARELNNLGVQTPSVHRWDTEIIKEWMIAELAPTQELVLPSGEIKTLRKRTHEMTDLEASEFADRVQAYFAEEGIFLPQPDSQAELKL